jgi:hypothetical protein
VAGTWSGKEIGTAAGKVWQFLNTHQPSSLTAIERGVDLPASLVHMGLGWLAREGKLALRQEKRTTLISLAGS